MFKVIVFFICIIVLGSIMVPITQSFRAPSGLQQCIRNCQQAYQGNPGYIRQCIERCRARY